MIKLITTFFYAGLMRPAPGTWGSLAALIVGAFVADILGFMGLAIVTTIAFVAGMIAIEKDTTGLDDPDKSEIVIDEVVGQWLAILPVSLMASTGSVSIFTIWPGLAVAFLLFRLFDIWKPGPIGWADGRGDAIGVMLDDIIAGTFAAVGVLAAAYLYLILAPVGF